MKIVELIIDAYKCKGDIHNDKLLLKTLIKAAKKVNAKIVDKFVHKYKPYGITVGVLLAESHISMYTWPEFKMVVIEIFLCNEKMNPYEAWKVIEEVILPENKKIKKFIHHIR